MMYVTKSTNTEFRAIMARRSSAPVFMLRKIRKDGTPGAAQAHQTYGTEKTAAEVIARLEKFNPGSHWIEAL